MTIDNVGNVGIGVTSPAEKLVVNGNIVLGKSDITSDDNSEYSIKTPGQLIIHGAMNDTNNQYVYTRLRSGTGSNLSYIGIQEELQLLPIKLFILEQTIQDLFIKLAMLDWNIFIPDKD